MSYEYVRDTYGEELVDMRTCGCYVRVDESLFDKESFDAAIAKESALGEWYYMDIHKNIDEETNVALYLGYFVVGFIMALGVVSMLNTMVNEQLQRKKEHAILRAIGLSRSGLNKMLLLEKLWMGLVSWVIGTVLGILLAWLYSYTLIYMAEGTFHMAWYVPCMTLVVILAVTGILSCIMIQTVVKMDISKEVRAQD